MNCSIMPICTFKICIRQEEGFCSFELSETNSGTPDSFDLDDGTTALVSKTYTSHTNEWRLQFLEPLGKGWVAS